jgi:hypothetical protein
VARPLDLAQVVVLPLDLAQVAVLLPAQVVVLPLDLAQVAVLLPARAVQVSCTRVRRTVCCTGRRSLRARRGTVQVLRTRSCKYSWTTAPTCGAAGTSRTR